MSTRKSLFLLGVASLGLTFWLYGQTDLIIMLSEQLWSCF